MLAFCVAALVGLVGVALLVRSGATGWRRLLAWLLPAVALVVMVVAAAGNREIQKVLGILLMPVGLLWLGLLAWTGAAALGRHFRLAAGLGLATALLTVSGNCWVGGALIGLLERQVPVSDPDAGAPFEAVFVLGGGTSLSAGEQPALAEAGDRVAVAAALWHRQRTPILVASGLSIPALDRSRHLGVETRALWAGLGIPPAAVVVIPADESPAADGPRITREEIVEYQRLCRARGWTRVGLVSSGWHLPRALAACRRIGFAPLPIPAQPNGPLPPFSLYYLIPQAKGVNAVQTACWEFLGLIVNR
jgi:uncharacterized SAM-binding protein YcdF (DUF218 family)